MAAPFASAQLVGDTITTSRHFPELDFVFGPIDVLVTDDTSDTFELSGGSNLFCNVDASSVRIDFGAGGGPFERDGHYMIFESLDHVGSPSAVIAGGTVQANHPVLTESDVQFGEHFVRLNFGNVDLFPGQFFQMNIEWRNVPAPSGILCMALGLPLAARRRR